MYVYPPTFLAKPDFDNKEASADVIESLSLAGITVLVTRTGGLFTVIPDSLIGERKTPEGHVLWEQMRAQLEFELQVCQAFNLLLCEFCLEGHVAEPASPAFLGTGQLHNNKIFIQRPPPAPVSYADRAYMPAAATRDDALLMLQALSADPDVLDRARSVARSTRLAALSPSLPEFIAASYALYSQHRLSEALMDAWIACEQIIDGLWHAYLSTINDQERRKRLNDTRTYSAAVRLEVLFSTSAIPEPLYTSLQKARRNRNNVAHRGKVDVFVAQETVDALRMLLGHIIPGPIAEFPPPAGPMWSLEP